MRHATIIVRLVCRNVHKRLFILMFSPLLLAVEAVKFNLDRIKMVSSFRNLHFATLKVGNFVILVVMSKTIFAKYPSKNFHFNTVDAPNRFPSTLFQNFP